MPSQADKNMTKAMNSLAKKEKEKRKNAQKRKVAAIKYGDTDMDFEIQNTFTEPMKKAKSKKEGDKIVDKLSKRAGSMDALTVKKNYSSKEYMPQEGAGKRIKRKFDNKFNKGGSAGSKLVASYYKGGKT
tara:strand:- start:72 stop:461 length:390 start_codon:yes stop_codon:yes gene_type:complete